MRIVKTTTSTAELSYVEEDGWDINRDGIVYKVFGTCEGTYEYSYTPGCLYMPNGDPGCPEEESTECLDFNVWVDTLEDEDGNAVDITLTDQEMNDFESYMRAQLDNIADNHAFVKED